MVRMENYLGFDSAYNVNSCLTCSLDVNLRPSKWSLKQDERPEEYGGWSNFS